MNGVYKTGKREYNCITRIRKIHSYFGKAEEIL